MKTTIPKLRKMIRKVISESTYGYGGHEGGSMASGQSGLGSDMPLPPKPDTSIVNWRSFKNAMERGDYDEARDFLVEIGCDDEMDQEMWMSDGLELSVDELAKEWSNHLRNQMM